MGIVFFSNHSNLLYQFGVTNSETEQKPCEEPSKRLLTPPFLSFDAASTCCVVTEKLLFSVTSLYRRYKSFYNYHIPFESINHTAITKFTSHSVSQSLWIKPTQTCIFLSFQNQVCPPYTNNGWIQNRLMMLIFSNLLGEYLPTFIHTRLHFIRPLHSML